MSMQAESLEILESAALPPSQARAIVRAIGIEIEGSKDVLATKHDIVLLHAEMAELRADIRGELKSEIANLRGELKSEIANLRGELKSEIGSVRGELKSEIASLRGGLRAEIHGSASSITRQMYTAMLGQMAVLLGIAYFFVTRLAG
jgi:hypothetical protein